MSFWLAADGTTHGVVASGRIFVAARFDITACAGVLLGHPVAMRVAISFGIEAGFVFGFADSIWLRCGGTGRSAGIELLDQYIVVVQRFL